MVKCLRTGRRRSTSVLDRRNSLITWEKQNRHLWESTRLQRQMSAGKSNNSGAGGGVGGGRGSRGGDVINSPLSFLKSLLIPNSLLNLSHLKLYFPLALYYIFFTHNVKTKPMPSSRRTCMLSVACVPQYVVSAFPQQGIVEGSLAARHPAAAPCSVCPSLS